MANKIDSNVTGLRYAEESSTIGTLPGAPVWYPLEPNSYQDFGGTISTVARNPINANRQRKKGVVTDLDASGGFNTDLTQTNLQRLLQGFFFADWREKVDTAPFNGTAVTITGVDTSTDDYEASSGLDSFAAGDLVFASGFSNAGNNGLKSVSSATSTALTVNENLVTEASPPAAARLEQVGFEMGSGEADIDVSSQTLPRLVRASGSVDFTNLNLVPGEWIYIGGDAANTSFLTAANNGWARVNEVDTAYIEFDLTQNTMVDETGTSLTIQFFFGRVLKNELAADITRRTYNIERTLGEDSNGTMSEYLVGAVPSQLGLNVATADKVTVDVSFVATDNEQRDGSTGTKSGTRPALEEADAFNTSSDFSLIKMALFTAGTNDPSALFAYLTELNLTVNNNLSPNKAISVLGAFDVTAGQFVVEGSLTAYFSDIAAVEAVRNNSDVDIHFAVVKNNAGMMWDIPLLALGEGRLNVEQDQPITLPLSMAAGENSKNYTLMVCAYPYLPSAADS